MGNDELRILRYRAERGRAAAQAWRTWLAADSTNRDREWEDLTTCLAILAREHGIEVPR